MPQYKSNITKIVAKTIDMNWEDITEAIFDRLGLYFQSTAEQQGLFASTKEQDTYTAVARYLIDRNPMWLKMEQLSEADARALSTDQKTLIRQEEIQKLYRIQTAENLQELDQHLAAYEEFLHRTLRISSGELEFKIATMLQKTSEILRESVEDIKRGIERKAGKKFSELDPQMQELWKDALEEHIGSRGDAAETKEATVIPFDSSRRKR